MNIVSVILRSVMRRLLFDRDSRLRRRPISSAHPGWAVNGVFRVTKGQDVRRHAEVGIASVHGRALPLLGRSRRHRPRVHHWLSEQAYWALGRARDVQDAAIDASRNFAVIDTATGAQVAYARVVTDGVTFAWLCDVFVDPEVRGEGVGIGLIEGVVMALEPLGLRRILLATADAHGLYEKFGFAALVQPERWMARLQG